MEFLQTNINKNREALEKSLNYPSNKDIVFRTFKYWGKDAFVAYVDGMADTNKISHFIMKPLLNSSDESKGLESLIQVSFVSVETTFNKVVSALLQGDAVVFIDGDNSSYICETKGFDRRGVERPQVENSIVGAQEAFTETFRTNTTLIRKIIKNEGLTTETVTLGNYNNLICGIVYINGLANQELVNQVKYRLENTRTDFAQSGGMVEQLIEDHASSLFQTITTTERPDNAAAFLMQGRVCIIVDGSPRVLVAPITLLSILKTSEESALRVPFASAVRAIRLIAVFAALLMPALYLAITTFHPEMIPGGLLLSIAKARLNIPYPAMLELLLMEVSFELIRESGERIPGLLGSTIGIVGGLILGEAAVSAGLVSQGCVIIIAFSGLGNFAIPQYQTAFAARLLRLVFIICAGFMGFLGIGVAFVVLVGYVNSLTSFGTDYVNPVFSGDTLFPKKPVWKYETRPNELETGSPSSQPKISRAWKKWR